MPSGPHPIDIHVGHRLRLRRTMLGMSQERLAAGLGLTFQQVQKYERGLNRIVASRLYRMGQVLDVPVSYFFEGLPETTDDNGDATLAVRRETLEMVRAFHRIGDALARRRLFELTKRIAVLAPGDGGVTA